MKKRNSGFTLVELLVTVVILGFVMIAVTSFMVTGSKMFNKGNADASVQREAQMVVNQIGDLIIDSIGGVEFKETADEKELILYNGTDTNKIKESVKWIKADEKIYYSKWKVEYDETLDDFVETEVIADKELLAEGVTDFYADITDTKDEYDDNGDLFKVVQSVQLKAEYKDKTGQVSYATTPMITLRNRMISGNAKMVYDKPERVTKEFTVDVKLNDFRYDGSHNLWIYVGGIVKQSGYNEGELEFQWSRDHEDRVRIEGSSTDPEECIFIVDFVDRDYMIQNGPITFTLTGTDHETTKSASLTFTIKPDFSGFGHERGDDEGRYPISINNPMYYRAYDYELIIKDDTGKQYLGKDLEFLLTHYLNIDLPDLDKTTGKPKTPFDPNGEPPQNLTSKHFNDIIVKVLKDIDCTKSFSIQFKLKTVAAAGTETGTLEEYTREVYIPKVSIESRAPICPWKEVLDNDPSSTNTGSFYKRFGTDKMGDGIRFNVSGFVRDKFRNNFDQYCYMTMADGTMKVDPNNIQGLDKDNYYVEFQPGALINDEGANADPRNNEIRTEFTLVVKDKNGNEIQDKDILKNIKIKKMDVKVHVRDSLYDANTNTIKNCPMCGSTMKLVGDELICQNPDKKECTFTRKLLSYNVPVTFE